MNRGNMARVSENSRESVPASAEVRAMLRHEYLLQDYLDLEKEFAFKKKKLQEAKERKQTLLDEVHFLRGRYQYLLELQSRGIRTEEVLGVEDRDVEEEKSSAVKAVSEQSLPVLEPETEEDHGTEEVEEADWWQPREHVKYKSILKSNKKVKRKNVSWQV